MNFGLNETPAIDLLREELLKLLELVREGKPDLARTKIPFSVFIPDFGINQITLTDDHVDTLANLAEMLQLDPAIEIDIVIGRASQTGNESNNQSLSEARAKAVLDELGALAIYPLPPLLGIGSSLPIADLPDQESELNRSVEIRMWYDLSYFYSGVDGPAGGNVHPVRIEAYEHAWDRSFRSLTDQELAALWVQMIEENLSDFENTRFHDYFVTTIINVSLERANRVMPTLEQKVHTAWSSVMKQLRGEDNSGKPDRNLTIYRDAERFLELASATTKGFLFSDTWREFVAGIDVPLPGGALQLMGIVLYDPAKWFAWSIYDHTDNVWLLEKLKTGVNLPSRPGGADWAFMGFQYMRLYGGFSELPIVPLPIGIRELVQQELMGP